MDAPGIVETEFGLAHPSGTPGSPDKALCHPKRPMVADGQCASCLAIRDQIDRVTQALTAQPDGGIAPLSKETLATREAMTKLYRYADFAEGVAEYARALLVHSLPEHAQLLLVAARVAAQEGNSRPMEFALQHARMFGGKTAVDAPEAAAGSGKGGVAKVYIGVQLGQMPATPVLSAHVITVDEPEGA